MAVEHRIASGRSVTARALSPERVWPFLPILCFGSGAAALVYEVVWFQRLELAIGASAVSLGVVLATFMAGLCLGSLLLWRLVSPRRHPLYVFALLELGIAAFGLIILHAMPALAGAYAASAGPGAPSLWLRAAVAGLVLLPPTVLMGATLPALGRFLETTRPGVARLGLLYGANIGGAVFGSLLAGFYLLRVHDVAVATYTAAALNALVAGASLALGAVSAYVATGALERVAGTGRYASRVSSGPVYVAIALSGMTALAAEVVWTRHLSLLLGATVYTFALILAVFLLGLGIGSAAGSALSRRWAPRTGLGACQLALAAAIAWAAYATARSLPYWPLDVTLPASPWIGLQLDLVRVAFAILPAALLWGASFPFALAAAASEGQDPGRLLGRVYAANTVGAIVGALGAGLWAVALLGSLRTQQLLIVVSVAAGWLVLAQAGARRWRPWLPRAVPGAAAAAAGLVIAAGVPELPGEFVAFGRFTPTRAAGSEVVYRGEGLTTSLAVTRDEGGRLTYHAAGKAQASSYAQDMRLQRMLGHLATLVPEHPQTVLVIGLGAGVTAGAVSIDPAVERIVVAEIEPLVPEVADRYFSALNFDVVDSPKVELHADDGRHYLATTDETFDAITSDPLDPWVKGAAALYTREFWELVESRLNPGGAVTVFLQLYESSEDAVRSEIATFFDVFENGAVFANTVRGVGYDAVLVGRADDAPIDLDRVEARLAAPESARLARSLAQVGFSSGIELFGTYAGAHADMADWLAGAAINRDRNLRLQYLAGQGLNTYDADAIYERMTRGGAAFPAGLFTGSPRTLDRLRAEIRRHRRAR